MEASEVFDWVSRRVDRARGVVRDWALRKVEGEGGEGRLLREDVEELLLRDRRGVQEME